ncbi:MAG: hypothetical protein ACOY0S_00675 [Patescibacteria group bacterium]
MKTKITLVFFIVVLLLLDLAALDDITTGTEPNYSGEYAILGVSLLIFGWLAYKWLYTPRT